MTNQRNYTLDLFRVVAAFIVVLIHFTAIYYENGINGLWDYYFYRFLMYIAVPIFFASMGYLIVSPERGKNARKALFQTSLKRARRYFQYYVVASLIYIAVDYLIVWMNKSYLNHDILQRFEHRMTITHFIGGTIGGVHLWFLMGATIAFLIFAFLFRIGVHPAMLIFITAPLYYVGHVLRIPYFSTIDGIVLDNGLFFSMMYISLGMFIRALNVKYRPWYFPLATILLLIFSFSKYYHVGPPSFTILFFSTFMFMLFVKSRPNIGQNKKWVYSFSRYGLFIYLYHLGFLQISNTILKIIFGLKFWELWWYPFVYIVAIIGPIVIYHMVYSPKGLYLKVRGKNFERGKASSGPTGYR